MIEGMRDTESSVSGGWKNYPRGVLLFSFFLSFFFFLFLHEDPRTRKRLADGGGSTQSCKRR